MTGDPNDDVYNALVADHIYTGSQLMLKINETVFFPKTGKLGVVGSCLCNDCMLRKYLPDCHYIARFKTMCGLAELGV